MLRGVIAGGVWGVLIGICVMALTSQLASWRDLSPALDGALLDTAEVEASEPEPNLGETPVVVAGAEQAVDAGGDTPPVPGGADEVQGSLPDASPPVMPAAPDAPSASAPETPATDAPEIALLEPTEAPTPGEAPLVQAPASDNLPSVSSEPPIPESPLAPGQDEAPAALSQPGGAADGPAAPGGVEDQPVSLGDAGIAGSAAPADAAPEAPEAPAAPEAPEVSRADAPETPEIVADAAPEALEAEAPAALPAAPEVQEAPALPETAPEPQVPDAPVLAEVTPAPEDPVAPARPEPVAEADPPAQPEPQPEPAGAPETPQPASEAPSAPAESPAPTSETLPQIVADADPVTEAEAEPDTGPTPETDPTPEEEPPVTARLPGSALPGAPVRRLPSIGDSVEEGDPEPAPAAATANPGVPALERHRIRFDAGGDNAPLAVVLIQGPGSTMRPGDLDGVGVPVTIAVPAGDAQAAMLIEAYRAAGAEVVLIPDLPPRPRAQDVEVSLAVALSTLPGAVALMDTGGDGFQSDRNATAAVLDAAKGSGHGVITYAQGFNSAQRAAEREGIPAALVERELSEGGPGFARGMDQSAFKARQQGGAIAVATATPSVLEALVGWSAAAAGSGVVLAPVSAVLSPE